MLKFQLRFKHSFQKLNSFAVPEFKVQVHEYKNKGARLVHIQTEDTNQAFATIFKSSPNNSHGTPHVLEHLMCCGSEKYPVKDPFMAMLKRSLNTYFNAWTGPDYICFPFSSQNPKDFQNLLDVTLDMVFKPTLNELDFKQEGFRVENSIIKGVVYNEMKGAMQNAESVFSQKIQEYLLNNTIYSHNSGGDPKDIIKLTHQEIKGYYKSTFNPQNAIFYHYGKQPNFEFIEQYLQGQQQTIHKQQTPIPMDPPQIIELPGTESEEKCNFVSFSYLLKNKGPVYSLGLQVLMHLLFDGQCALLQPIIEEELAESFAKNYGVEYFGDNAIFSISFEGIEDKDSVEPIKKRVHEILNTPFAQENIEAALLHLETQYKRPTANQGIKILEELISPLLNQQSVHEYLSINDNLNQLRTQIQSGLLSDIIKDFGKQYVFYGEPQDEYVAQLQEDEQAVVETMKEDTEFNKQLLNRPPSDFTILPTVTLDDIAKFQPVSFEVHEFEGVKIHTNKQVTNGLTSIRLKFNLGQISDGTRQYLDMFSHFLNKFGTQAYTSQEMSLLFNQCSSGLEIQYDCVEGVGTYVLMSISCLNEKLDQTMKLLELLFTDAYFQDKVNLSTVLRQNRIDLQNHIIDEQLRFASEDASSSVCYPYSITNCNLHTRFQLQYAHHFLQADGMKRTFYVDDFDFQMTSFLQLLFNQNRMSVIVHYDHLNLGPIKDLISGVKNHFKAFTLDEHHEIVDPFTTSFKNRIVTIPSQINCNVRAYPVPTFGHVDCPPLHVMAELISHNYLHTQIRELGGAYGARCRLRSFKGVMNLLSYQDPNIMKTFEAFDRFTLEGSLDEAKLSVFQKMDEPVAPFDRGIEALALRYTPEQELEYRRRILDCKLDDIRRVYENYIHQKPYSQTSFASQDHPEVKSIKWEKSTFNFD